MRVQRAIARAGLASRRAADALVAEGRVTVNGVRAVIGQVVSPESDDIRVDGKVLPSAAKARWFVLHKPLGVMTTRRDPSGRRTVFELVPEVPGLTYVGRLDYLTSGVLLLTNDGEAANRLSHPSGEVPRTYIAVVQGDAEHAAVQACDGVMLEDGVMRADTATVTRTTRNSWEFEVTLHEGRNREVRRLCETLGLRVQQLTRTAYGPITLGTLRSGEWRELHAPEVKRLLKTPVRRRSSAT